MQQRVINGVDVRVCASSAEAGGQAAEFFIGRLRQVLADQEEARIIFATGVSQYALLAVLIEQKDIDWSRVTAFHLDEYIDLPETHPASFRNYLQTRLFSHLPFKAVHVLNGNAKPITAECARYEGLLKQAPIDIACVGIGENAHLAFNDPPADFQTEKWVDVVILDHACRMQQVNEGHFAGFADVPAQALTLTIPAILAAKVISCVAPDARKAQAVGCALTGPVTPECPASALQQHPACTVFLDTASAGMLAPSS